MRFPAFDHHPSKYVLLEGSLIVFVTGIVDWLTGFEVSVSLFYGIPIMFVIWFGDRKSGFLVAILCGITWWWADILAGHIYPFIGWQSGNRLRALAILLSSRWAVWST